MSVGVQRSSGHDPVSSDNHALSNYAGLRIVLATKSDSSSQHLREDLTRALSLLLGRKRNLLLNQ
jgi:hypothetical protein